MYHEISCYTAWHRYNGEIDLQHVLKHPLCFVDTETTGLSRRDVIIELSMCRVEPSGERKWFSSLVDNGLQGIDPKAAAVHGITQEMLADAPIFAELSGDIYSMLDGAYWIGHNARFDVDMLQRSWYDCTTTELPYRGIIDTLHLTKRLAPNLPSYALGNLAKHYNLQTTIAHRATADVETLLQLWMVLLETL